MPLMTPKFGYHLGRKRDHFDPRDYVWRAGSHLLGLVGPAPSNFDTHPGLAMPTIFDQGAEGSCTANAGTRWFEWLSLRFPQFTIPLVALSRQGLYACERMLSWNNDLDQDAGAGSRDIFYVLRHTGIMPESDDPYGPDTLYAQPSAQGFQDAAQRRIGAYHRVVSVSDLKACLLSGYSATLGFAVYDSFEDIGPDGIWNPDVENEGVVGGHEVYVHGFDDSVNGGSFLIDNSWGMSWGMGGSFWMPYSFLNNYDASQWDCWTGHFGRPWK
jgi:C1A family cysteine protease